MNNIPISQNVIEPIIKSNIRYVNNLEEFEAIKLDTNQTVLCFDNNQSCFYVRACDKYGEMSPVKVYFYEDFATHMKRANNNDFYEKCKALKLDPLKTELAYKFFIDNEKTQKVWLWLLETKKADWEYDTVKYLKCKLKKEFLALEQTKR
jgi:hypothetical protein